MKYGKVFFEINNNEMVNLDQVTHTYRSGRQLTFYLNRENATGNQKSITAEFDSIEECSDADSRLMGI